MIKLTKNWHRYHTANGLCEYYGVAEPPVRKNESHHSGLTEPPFFTLIVPVSFHKLPS